MQIMSFIHTLGSVSFYFVQRGGVLGRVPAFQPGSPGSIPGEVRNFTFYPGTGCVSFIWVLSCVVPGGDPDIMLTDFTETRPCVFV